MIFKYNSIIDTDVLILGAITAYITSINQGDVFVD